MRMARNSHVRFRLYVAAILASVECTSCAATSRLPQAQVKQVDGRPCFTVADESEARKGIPLYSLVVSEQQSRDWRSLPDELWSFGVEPPGNSIEISPDTCIRYGDVPPSATAERDALPLRLNHVYVVFLGARPKGGSVPVVGYRAEFCLKLSGQGKAMVQVVRWDTEFKRWRYEECAAP